MADEGWEGMGAKFDDEGRLTLDVDGVSEPVLTALRKHGVDGACAVIILPKLTRCPKPVLDCAESS